jgi:hypothetical protein
MELSSLTLRVLLLFFPGVLCAMLVDVLTRRRDDSPGRFLTSAFVLGIGSYLLLYGARELCALSAALLGLRPPLQMTFFTALVDERQRIAWGEIALAALIAIPLAGLVAAVVNHQLFGDLAKRLKIARGFGERDVWTWLFDSPDVRWVIVRDLANDLTFKGAVEAFSDTGERPELLLNKVTVYRNSSGAKLYETAKVYLSRPSEVLLLELGAIGGESTDTGANHGRDDHPSSSAGKVQEGRSEPRTGSTAPGLPSGADGDPVPDPGSG